MQLEHILTAALAASDVKDEVDDIPDVPQTSPAVPLNSPYQSSFSLCENSTLTDISNNSCSQSFDRIDCGGFRSYTSEEFNKPQVQLLNSDNVRSSTFNDILYPSTGDPSNHNPCFRNLGFSDLEYTMNNPNYTSYPTPLREIEFPDKEKYGKSNFLPSSELSPCDPLENVSDELSLFNLSEDSLVITSQQALAMFENNDDLSQNSNFNSSSDRFNTQKITPVLDSNPKNNTESFQQGHTPPSPQIMDGVEDVINSMCGQGVPAACGEVEIQTSDIIAKASDCLNDITSVDELQDIELDQFSSDNESVPQYTSLQPVHPSLSFERSQNINNDVNLTELKTVDTSQLEQTSIMANSDYRVQVLAPGITMSFPNDCLSDNLVSPNSQEAPPIVANESKNDFDLLDLSFKNNGIKRKASLMDEDVENPHPHKLKKSKKQKITLSKEVNLPNVDNRMRSKKFVSKASILKIKKKKQRGKKLGKKFKKLSVQDIYMQSTLSLSAPSQNSHNDSYNTQQNPFYCNYDNFFPTDSYQTNGSSIDVKSDAPFHQIRLDTSNYSVTNEANSWDRKRNDITPPPNNGGCHQDYPKDRNSDHGEEDVPIIMSQEEYQSKILDKGNDFHNTAATHASVCSEVVNTDNTDGDSLKVQLVYLVYPFDKNKGEYR